jgi:hypothetical protein
VAQPTPQQLVHTQQPVTQQQQPSLNMARLRAQGLRPKPTLVHQQQQQQQQQLDGVQEWSAYCAASQQELALPPEAFAPAGTDAVAAAAARDLLEWQFQLQQDGGGGSSGGATSSSSSSGSVLAAQEAAAALGASQLLQGLSSSPGDAGRQLTSAIMRAQHWRQVQSLIQEHAPSCVNVLHLCAALTRLAHVQYSFVGGGAGSIGSSSVNPHAAAFVQQLFDGIGTRLAELEYRQTCNVVWAAAALQHVVAPEPAWMASLYRQAAAIFSSEKLTQHEQAEALPERQQQAAQLQQQVNDLCHAAQLSYALAKLQDRLPQAQVARYVGWIVDNTRNILQQHIQQHQPAAAPHGSSSSSSSSSSAQQQRQQRPVKHQHQLRARDMATLAWSLSKLCAEPSPAWLSALAAALGCRGLVSAGNYRDLSQLLWSLATFSRHAAAGSAAANSIHAAASAVLGVAQDTHLASCDGQALSNTLWALATLGQRPPLPYLNRLLTHAAAAASRGFLNPQGISNTLWGLAALGVVPQASCMAALQAAAQQQLPHMTPQGLSNTLWALAVLERPPSKGWLAAFWPACRSALPHMTSQAVVNCLWALARLGLQPPQEWLGDVAALLLRGLGLSSLSSQGVANILWAMSRVSICCTGGHALLMGSLQQAVAMLQQQLAQQELPGGQAAAFNTCELSALANAACYLQQRQQAEASVLVHGDSSGSSSSHGAYAASAALVLQLAHLTQTASRMLLPKASPSELAILLRSQVVLPSRGHAHQQPHHQQAQQPAAPVPSAWVDAWLDASNGAFSAASSRDLATWVWCLAVRGQRPSTEWLASWQVATFRQLPRASSQDLSNSLWALASLGVAPEAAWLQRHLAEVSRRQLQKQLLPQHYANLAHALAKLGHRPDRDWLERFQADVVALVPQFKPQELTCALWALAQLNAKADEVRACARVPRPLAMSWRGGAVSVARARVGAGCRLPPLSPLCTHPAGPAVARDGLHVGAAGVLQGQRDCRRAVGAVAPAGRAQPTAPGRGAAALLQRGAPADAHGLVHAAVVGRQPAHAPAQGLAGQAAGRNAGRLAACACV